MSLEPKEDDPIPETVEPIPERGDVPLDWAVEMEDPIPETMLPPNPNFLPQLE